MVAGLSSTPSVAGVVACHGSPWENGYNESFNGKLRDELLNGEIFFTLREAPILVEQWRVHYNTVRPPAPQTLQQHLSVLALPIVLTGQ